MRALLVLMTLAAAAFAGCASAADPDETGPASPTTTSNVHRSNQASGASLVKGVVYDDEQLPVANVTVTLLETEDNVTTGPDGRYAFEGLEGGYYTLTFDHRDFKGAGRSVQVPPAETVELDVFLLPLVFDTPYSETLIYEGYMPLGNAWADIDFGCQATGGYCRHDFTSSVGLETIVTEVSFTPTLANPTGTTRLYFQLRHVDFEPLYADGYMAAPWDGHHVFGDWPRDAEVGFYQTTVCDLFFVACPEQRFTNYVTLFYFEKAPEGWTFDPEA